MGFADKFRKPKPEKITWVEKTNGRKYSGFPENTPELQSGSLIRVNYSNYPNLYKATKEVTKFFCVEEPAIYVDTSGNTKLGYADPEINSIVVEHRALEIFNHDEIKALLGHEIKHLHQKESRTWEDVRENEHDSDRAAVSVAGLEALESYIHKAAKLEIERLLETTPTIQAESSVGFQAEQSFLNKATKFILGKTLGLKPIANALLDFHDKNPGLLTEAAFFRTDKAHPSPRSRMQEIKRYHEAHGDEQKAQEGQAR